MTFYTLKEHFSTSFFEEWNKISKDIIVDVTKANYGDVIGICMLIETDPKANLIYYPSASFIILDKNNTGKRIKWSDIKDNDLKSRCAQLSLELACMQEQFVKDLSDLALHSSNSDDNVFFNFDLLKNTGLLFPPEADQFIRIEKGCPDETQDTINTFFKLFKHKFYSKHKEIKNIKTIKPEFDILIGMQKLLIQKLGKNSFRI